MRSDPRAARDGAGAAPDSHLRLPICRGATGSGCKVEPLVPGVAASTIAGYAAMPACHVGSEVEVRRGLTCSGVAHVLALSVLGTLTLLSHPVAAQSANVARVSQLADLSLEELRDVVVSSVARRDQPLLEAAASVYVISGDEIRRLGATTLPEALRLAPNLQVAAIDARQYAISARGFNGNISNKLLVMVDGRRIYSPLFSGVFWDAQTSSRRTSTASR